MTLSVALVGGGLANCLLALRLRARRPGVSLTLIESGDRLGGNHTWSFQIGRASCRERVCYAV